MAASGSSGEGAGSAPPSTAGGPPSERDIGGEALAPQPPPVEAARLEHDAHADGTADPLPAEPAYVDPAPALPAPALPGPPEPKPKFIITLRGWLRDYFLGDNPSFTLAVVPFCFLAIFLFTRHPTKTNFIFDEQEALLANPYVRSVIDAHPKFGWLDAFKRDFWGLGPERSIGSYRPIPNLVWRVLWIVARDSPFLHHWVNVLIHGVNGALMCLLVMKLTQKRQAAWFAGAAFTASAVLTEAVSGVVGIADVLGATGTLVALLALGWRLPWMAVGVFLATSFGLYSKESALACVPLLPVFALLGAQVLHPKKPARWLRAYVAFAAAATAFVLYVELRRRWFPAALPHELSAEANAGKPWGARTFAALLRWYAQPTLPKDPLNNPFVNADGPHRIAGALRVFFRGAVQVVFPHTLSGDYSAPQEPIPPSLFGLETILGGVLFVLPFVLVPWFGISAYRRWSKTASAAALAFARRDRWIAVGAFLLSDAAVVLAFSLDFKRLVPYGVVLFLLGGVTLAVGLIAPKEEDPAASLDDLPLLDAPPQAAAIDLRPIFAAAALWIVVCYFPVSNIPVLLPTVRAERFWYFPVIGSSLLLGCLFAWLHERFPKDGNRRNYWIVRGGVLAFFLFQIFAARNHANDYTDDLVFWGATRKSVPRSAKAHLNYSVMKGARGDLAARLDANRTALELAPQWPMASVYLGDTLCRLHRVDEAWAHYKKGFELAPNDVNLVALAMQCLWDEKAIVPNGPLRDELDAVKDKNPGSWVEYLGRDVLEHGEEHNGVDPKYRPRGYNEGPKD